MTKILINTVPKSGTHLMEQLVLGIPGVRVAKSRFVTEQNIHELHTMLPNEMAIGHIAYSKENFEIIMKMEIKQIFVYRDFRDTVVSAAHYIVNKFPHSHPLYHLYDQRLNRRFEDLVSCLIEGVQHPPYPGLYQAFRPFFPWREAPGILTLRYEDLVLNWESRYNTCKKILDYIYGNIANEWKYRVIPLMMQNVNPSKSLSYRRGAIGDWNTELNDRQKEVLKKQVGPLLIKWGYEKDENW